MCGSTPWDNLPISLFVLTIQSSFFSPTMRWLYSSEAPVPGLIPAWEEKGDGANVGDRKVLVNMENRAT